MVVNSECVCDCACLRMHVYVHVTVHGWVDDVWKSEGSYFLVFVQNQNFSLTPGE